MATREEIREGKCEGCGGIGRVQEYLYEYTGLGREWRPTGKWEECHNCKGSGIEETKGAKMIKVDTECMKCEEIISEEEFERNQGLCDKCYIRLCFVKELNSHRENTLL